MSGPFPLSGPGLLQLVGDGEAKELFRGAAWGRVFLSLSRWPAGSETQASTGSTAARTRGAPWWLGQNFVSSRSWFICQSWGEAGLLQYFGARVFLL